MLNVTNINKSFFHRPVLKDISFRIDPGEVVGLLGKNGAGKSTLLRMIAGLSSIDRGTLFFRENEIKSGNFRARKDLLYLGHAAGLYPPLSAIENLSFARQLYGLPNNNKVVLDALELVGLTSQIVEPIKVYSYGMLQRLKLALAQVIPWSLLLFDEPFSGLDLQGRKLTDSILKDWKENGKTLLLVVHDLEWALSFSSRVILLDSSKIFMDDTVTTESRYSIRKTYAELMS